jgi:hypothetical protein
MGTAPSRDFATGVDLVLAGLRVRSG